MRFGRSFHASAGAAGRATDCGTGSFVVPQGDRLPAQLGGRPILRWRRASRRTTSRLIRDSLYPLCEVTRMGWAKWRHTLNESRRLAIKAVDEYNSSAGHYADFIGTMVRAWLYLLQAEFQRDKTDDRYWDRDGKLVRLKGGEHKRWDVTECVQNAYPQNNDPVRLNLELFILLRNKVEHRFEAALKEIAGGKAHALVINYERRLAAVFGADQSLGSELRLPIFVESITAT